MKISVLLLFAAFCAGSIAAQLQDLKLRTHCPHLFQQEGASGPIRIYDQNYQTKLEVELVGLIRDDGRSTTLKDSAWLYFTNKPELSHNGGFLRLRDKFVIVSSRENPEESVVIGEMPPEMIEFLSWTPKCEYEDVKTDAKLQREFSFKPSSDLKIELESSTVICERETKVLEKPEDAFYVDSYEPVPLPAGPKQTYFKTIVETFRLFSGDGFVDFKKRLRLGDFYQTVLGYQHEENCQKH